MHVWVELKRLHLTDTIEKILVGRGDFCHSPGHVMLKTCRLPLKDEHNKEIKLIIKEFNFSLSHLYSSTIIFPWGGGRGGLKLRGEDPRATPPLYKTLSTHFQTFFGY